MKSVILILCTLVLTACGGGGSAPTGNSANNNNNSSLLARVNNQTSSNNLVINIATGDLNGDGLDDVVIGGWNSSLPTATITVLIQNADGTMTNQTNTWLQNNVYGGSQHTFIADFNNDGKMDVFLPGFDDSNSGEYAEHSVVLINTGTSFNRTDLSELNMAHGACVDDINGDGYLDVLVGGGYTDSLGHASVGGIYLNDGNHLGTFTLDSVHLAPVTSNNFFSTCSVIHETNGNIDILFGNTNNVANYRNNIVVFDSQLNIISNTGINLADGNGHSTTGSDLIDSTTTTINGNQAFVAIYNMLGSNGVPAYAGDQAEKVVLTNTAPGVYTTGTVIDTNYENMYFTSKLTIGGYPSVFFSGSNDQATLYQIINGVFTPYKQTSFTTMAQNAGISNPTTINYSVNTSIVYENNGVVYMLQLLNGVWYTGKM